MRRSRRSQLPARTRPSGQEGAPDASGGASSARGESGAGTHARVRTPQRRDLNTVLTITNARYRRPRPSGRALPVGDSVNGAIPIDRSQCGPLWRCQ
jgi:hypothetical protein